MQETELIAELRRLPLRPSSVTRVLAVLDDPSKGATDVAVAVAPDAGLCARILHLANSPYFGSSGRVASLDRAVVTVGNSVVRSLAISTAAGLLGDKARVPDGFWSHSGAVGVASALLAQRLGTAHGDALCAGLLHDLGCALAHRYDRVGYAEVTAGAAEHVLEAEQLRYGADHAHLAAIALRAWRLPASIVDAVEQHHGDLDATGPNATVAVAGGEALVRRALGDDNGVGLEPASDPDAILAQLGLPADVIEALCEQVQAEGDELGAVLLAA
jgi:putative nucleotidyltransferase with HDIG domain